MQNVHAGEAEGPRVRSRSGARAQGELICFLNRAQLPNQTKDETITNYTTQQQHKLQQQQQQQYVPLPRNNAVCQCVPLQPVTSLSSEVWICTAPLALCDKDRASDRVTVERSRERGRHAKAVVREPRHRPALLVAGLCGTSTSAPQRQPRTSCPRLPGQVCTGARSRALCGSNGRPRPGHPALLSLVVYVNTYICIVMVMFMVLMLNTLHRSSRKWTSRPIDPRCCLLLS